MFVNLSCRKNRITLDLTFLSNTSLTATAHILGLTSLFLVVNLISDPNKSFSLTIQFPYIPLRNNISLLVTPFVTHVFSMLLSSNAVMSG